MQTALLVFAKQPIPGAVKTRLTTLLTSEEAADLYTAFLKDALAQYATLGADIRLYVAPPGNIPPEWLPESVRVFHQKGKGLGERMLFAFLETFKAGYERIAIIGTDHPTLPTTFLEMAFEALKDRYSMVIGPTDDGGYYLLGMNEWYPEVFENMTYSHPDVFEQTLGRMEETDATVTILPEWYDVDLPNDLSRLITDMAESPTQIAQNTRQFVKILTNRYPQLHYPIGK
ncbi:MAG: TIGR04282 family arsenosugar biosynthesis glycosyltransferase [Rhodothermia bacterium]|nr:TIGR04282 family arsenosugar biosynthesis glycosyltransferase [Rhodothermia bacterium]